MATPAQPSFSTLARAVGGRYDPTTPRGQELLKQDMLNEAMRAEAQRAAKSAMEERKALQYIQQESARPSRQEAPGVRSIFKDGRLVGYSTTPEINAMASPIQKNPMGTALERGFISALKKADILKAQRDAAEKAAEREASKTPRSRMNRDTSGVRVSGEVPRGAELQDEVGPREVIAGDVFGTGYLPMGSNNPFAAALASAFAASRSGAAEANSGPQMTMGPNSGPLTTMGPNSGPQMTMGPNSGPTMPELTPEQVEALRILDARGYPERQTKQDPRAPSRFGMGFIDYFPGNDYDYLQKVFPGRSIDQILQLFSAAPYASLLR